MSGVSDDAAAFELGPHGTQGARLDDTAMPRDYVLAVLFSKGHRVQEPLQQVDKEHFGIRRPGRLGSPFSGLAASSAPP